MSDGASLGTAEGRIIVDTSQAVSSLESLGSMMSRMDQMGSGGIDRTGQSLQQLSTSATAAGRVVTGLGLAMAAPFAAGIKVAADFDQQLANIASVGGAEAQERMEEIRKTALQLGADTSFSASEAAAGMEEMIKAGIPISDVLGGAAQAALDLSAATGTAVPESAELMSTALNIFTDSMTGFNSEGEKAEHIANLFGQAANASATDVHDLGMSFKQSALVAEQFNIPVEDLTAQLGIFANAGLKGSDAGTSFKTMLLSMLDPTEKQASAMADLGLSFFDAEGNFIGLDQTATQLRGALAGLTDEQRQTALAVLFGSDAVRAASILYEQGAGAIDEFKGKMDEAGTVQEQAAVRLDTFQGALEKLKGSLETAAIIMGSFFLEPLKLVAEAVAELVNIFINLPGPVQQFIAIVGGAAAALTLLTGGALLVVGQLASMGAALVGIGVSAAGIAAVLTGVALAIAAVGLAAVAYNTNLLGFKDLLDGIGGAIRQFADDAKEGAEGAANSGRDYNTLEESIIGLGTALVRSGIGPVRDMGLSILEMGEGAFQARRLFENLTKKGVNPLIAATRAAGAFFDEWLGGFGTTGAGDILGNAADAMQRFADTFDVVRYEAEQAGFSGLAANVSAFGQAIDAALGTNVGPQFTALALAIQTVDDTFRNAIDNGINPFSAALGALAAGARSLGLDAIADGLSQAAEGLTRFGDAYRHAFAQSTLDASTGLASHLRGIGAAISELTGQDVAGPFEALADAIDAADRAAKRAEAEGINPLVAALIGLREGVAVLTGQDLAGKFDALGAALQGVGDAATGLLGAGIDRLGQFFSQLGSSIQVGDLSGALDAVKSLISDIGSTLLEAGRNALEWTVNVAAPTLKGWAEEYAGRASEWVTEKLGGAISLAGETLANVQGWIIEVGAPQLLGWVQGAIESLKALIATAIPAAGAVLGEAKDWILEVGAPKIQEVAGDVGGIKDAILAWIDEQIVMPDVSELPSLEADAQQLGTDLGNAVITAISSAFSALMGGGGGGGAFGSRDTMFGGADAESGIMQTIDTAMAGFVKGIALSISEHFGADSVSTLIESGDFAPLFEDIKAKLDEEVQRFIADIKTIPDQFGADIQAAFATLFEALNPDNPAYTEGSTARGADAGPGGTSQAQAMLKPISDAFGAVVDGIGDLAGELGGRIKEKLGSLNPFDEIFTTLQGWADETLGKIQAWSDGLGAQFNAAVEGAPLPVQSVVRGFFPPPDQTEAEALAAAEEFTGAVERGGLAGIASGLSQYGEKAKQVVLDEAGNVDLVASGEVLGNKIATDIDTGAGNEIQSLLESESQIPAHLQDGVGRAIDRGIEGTITALPKVGTGGGTSIGAALEQVMSSSVEGLTFEQFSNLIGQKIGEAVLSGLSNATTANFGGSGGGTAAAGIGQSIVSALTVSLQGADFAGVGTAISAKISEALSTGLEGGGAQIAGSGDTAGAGIGSSIASSLAGSLANADFAAVGQAIQAKIGEALSTGASGGEAASGDAAGAAGGALGASIASSLASSVTSADFAAVGAAIQSKIAEAVSQGTTAAPQAGLGGTGGGGGGIGASIAASLSSEIASADFSAIGQAIATQIGETLASTSTLNGAMTTMVNAAVQAGVGAASQAVQIGQMIATHAGSGAAASTALSGAVTTLTTAAIQTGVGAASGGVQIGSMLATHAGSGAASSSAFSGGVTTMTTAAIQAGVGASSGAVEIGNMVATHAGEGAASSGALNGATETMVGAAIDAGVGAAGGAVAIGEAISSGAASGIDVNALVGPAVAMVNNAISAANEAAGTASPSKVFMEIGGWLSEGAAIGVDTKAGLLTASVTGMVSDAVNAAGRSRGAISQLRALGEDLGDLPGLHDFGSQIASISDALASESQRVADRAQEVIDRLRQKLRDGAKGARQDGQNLGGAAGSGIASGLAAGGGSIDGAALDTGKGIVGDLGKMESDVDALRALSEQLSNLPGLSTFGAQLAAIADSIEEKRGASLESAKGLLKDLEQEFRDSSKRMKDAATAVGAETATGVSEGLASGGAEATSTAQSLIDQITGSLNANLTRLPEMAEAMGTAVGTEMADGLAAQGPIVEEAALGLGSDLIDGLSRSTPEAMDQGGGVVDWAVQGMEDAASEQSEFARQIGELISTTFGEGFAGGADPAAAFEMVTNYHAGIREAVGTLSGQVQEAGTRIGTAFGTGVDQANPTGAGKALVDEAAAGISSGTTGAANAADKAGGDIGSSLSSAIEENCGPANNAANGLTDDCIPSGIEAGTGKAMNTAEDAGQDISDSLVDGLDVKKKDVEREFTRSGDIFGKGMASGIGATEGDNVKATQSVIDRAGNEDGKTEGVSVGESFGQGIAQGIENYIPEIIEAAKKAVKKAEEGAKEEGKSKSPSLVFAEVGRDLMAGMEMGIVQGTPGVEAASRQSVRSVESLMRGESIETIARDIDRSMGVYTEAVEKALAKTANAVSRSRILSSAQDVVGVSSAGSVRDVVGSEPAGDSKSITINGLTVQKDSDTGRAAEALIDILLTTSGQYTGA